MNNNSVTHIFLLLLSVFVCGSPTMSVSEETRVVPTSDQDQAQAHEEAAEEPDKMSLYFANDFAAAYNDFSNGAFSKAMNKLKSLSHTPNFREFAKLYFFEAISYFEQEEYKKAQRLLTKSLDLRKSNSDAIYYLARTKLKEGETQTAEKLFEEALWYNRFSFVSHAQVSVELAKIYQAQGLTEKAEVSFKKAGDSKVLQAEDVLFISAQQLEKGNKAQAIEVIRKQLKETPDDPELKHGLASTLLHEADWLLNRDQIKEAIELLNEIIPEDPKEKVRSPYFHTYISSLLIRSDLTGAFKLLDEGLTIDPNNKELLALKEQADLQKAGKDFEEALKLEKSST